METGQRAGLGAMVVMVGVGMATWGWSSSGRWREVKGPEGVFGGRNVRVMVIDRMQRVRRWRSGRFPNFLASAAHGRPCGSLR